MRPCFVLFFVALLLSGPVVAQPAWIRDSLDIFVNRAMQIEQVPGLALAVVQDGKVVLQRTYGVRGTGRPDRVDENTLFMIGSNTKAYTATLLTVLESEGKLSLDDKVTRWLPKFRLNDGCATNMATVRDLLCHRLGMRTFQGDFTFWGSSLTREEVMEKMAAMVPTYEFRARYGYCNSAFLTAGQMIPVIAGKPWEQFVRERIFQPLQMTRATALSAEMPAATNAARPHARYDGKLQLLAFPTIDNLAPAASISLSINDMTHWLLMQLDTGRYQGKQIFPKNVILKTWNANTIVSPQTGYSYGLGWFISYPGGKKMLDHTGGVDGFLSASAFLPEQRLGVIVLTNTDNNALFGSVRDQLLQVYRGESGSNKITEATAAWLESERVEADHLAKLRQEVTITRPLAASALQNYLGTYTHPLYGEVEVVAEENQLRVRLSHHPKATATLQNMDKHVFLCTFGTPTLGIHPMAFKMGSDGKATGLSLKVNDFVEYGTYEFERKGN